jgi:hypothetical protein
MYYLTAFEDTQYFLWQIQVQHYNFMEKGIDLSKVINLVGYKGETPNIAYIDYANKVRELGITTIFYKDEVANRNYLPLLRPNLLKRFFRDNPHYKNDYFLIHDADIIFNNIPAFEGMKDGRWHLADTKHYIGYDYLKTIAPTTLQGMVDCVEGITIETLINKNANSGGAQYFGKDNSYILWHIIEQNTQKLFDYMYPIQQSKRADRANGIDTNGEIVQAWTAGMWAELWTLWLFGNTTVIDEELNFTTAIHSREVNNTRNIYHNAGVESKDAGNYFAKQIYTNVDIFTVDFSFIYPHSASFDYVQTIRKTFDWLKTL